MNCSEDKVAVVKGEDRYIQVCKALELLGGIDTFFKKGQRILLKVNVTGPAPEGAGITTNKTLVEAVARVVCEAGATPILADGTASTTIGTVKVFELCGYNSIKEKYPQTEFLDLNRGTVIDVKVENPLELESIRVSKAVMEGCDLIVDLPVLKTHVMAKVSLSLKNLKGVIPPAEKRHFHDLGLPKCIADLASVVRPGLIIADGTIGSEGMGPKEGTPVKLDTVIAGTHTVTVDAACCYIMGFDPHDVEHIVLSHEKIGGEIDREKIEILGDSIESVKHDFLPACPVIPENGKLRIISGSPCSGCIGAALIAASRLTQSGILDDLNARGIYPTFAIGAKYDPQTEWASPDDMLFLGNCAKVASKGKGDFFPGCPPASIHITEYLAEKYSFSHEALENGSERAVGGFQKEKK